MKISIRTLMLTGITAACLTLAAAGVNAQQRMGKGNAMFTTDAPFPPPGMAGGHMGMHGFGHGGMGTKDILRMAERLDLTQAQRDRIGKIIDDARPKLRKNAFEMMDNRKEIHALMQQDKMDDKKLRTLTRRQGELMADEMYLQMKMRSDIHAVLTDEQREKLKGFKGRFFRRGMRGDAPNMPGENS